MNGKTLVLVSFVSMVVTSCGRGAPPSGEREIGAKPAAAASVASAPPPAVVGTVPSAPPAALPSCTDGGAFRGGRISEQAVRFCIGDDPAFSCWSVDRASGAVTSIASLGPPVAGELDVPALDLPMPNAAFYPPAPSAWKVEVKAAEALEACGPDGCHPFAVQPPVDGDDDRTAIGNATISSTGTRIAVTRGEALIAPMTVELYDRASGKKLGSVRPKTQCAIAQAFAGETAVFAEWSCVEDGGELLLMSARGKLVGRVAGEYPRDAAALQLDGNRWAFLSYSTIAIHDVVTGERLARLPSADARVFVAEAGGGKRQLYVFDNFHGRVVSYASDGKQLFTSRAPTCRYEWESESLGGLQIEMPVANVIKLVGAPKKKTKPDAEAMFLSTWSYDRGLTLLIEASNTDPNFGGPVLPFRVVQVVATAPSALRTKAGIGIGSTRAEVEAAYGKYVVESRSTADRVFIGNEATNDLDGLIFDLGDDKVIRMSLGRAD